MNLDYKSIGKRIKIARIKSDMTQEQLAEKIDLSPTHLSNIETGTTRVSLATIVSLANALSVTVDHLLCEDLVCAKPLIQQEISDLLADCSDSEIRFLRDILAAVKDTLRKEYNLRQRDKQ